MDKAIQARRAFVLSTFKTFDYFHIEAVYYWTDIWHRVKCYLQQRESNYSYR